MRSDRYSCNKTQRCDCNARRTILIDAAKTLDVHQTLRLSSAKAGQVESVCSPNLAAAETALSVLHWHCQALLRAVLVL
jgi:hypothetical protein